MKRLRGILWLVVVWPAVAFGQDTGADLAKQVETKIEPLVKTGFSGCVLVERNGKVVLRKGYGFADREAKRANAPEYHYDIGSVTKPIVAATVLRLVERGKVRLDSTLGELFPATPADKRGITIEQLLAHTSGLPAGYDFENVDLTRRQATVDALLGKKLGHRPGEKHEYSNANYFLLAAVVEVASQQTYETCVRESTFQPLKMAHTGFGRDRTAVADTSPRRYENGKSLGPMHGWPHGWGHRGATGILSTVDDLAAFARALRDDSLFGAKMRAQWLAVRKSNYALGWSVLERPDRPTVVVHAGAAPGSRAILAYYPASGVALVVLMNASDPGALHEWSILRGVEASIGNDK